MTDIDLGNLDLEEEETNLTPSEIYDELLAVNEMILTIPAEQEDKLRKGLASAKAKQNAKLKDAGLGTDKAVLSFTSHPSTQYEGAVEIHITLSRKNGIKIINKQYPDPEF